MEEGLVAVAIAIKIDDRVKKEKAASDMNKNQISIATPFLLSLDLNFAS